MTNQSAAVAKPGTFRVQRTRRIQAPPEAIFALIEDFRRWPAWSPYEKLDPEMRKTYSGPATGRGSVYQWQGNRKAGEGRMEIVETVPSSVVRIQLDFLKPFEGHNTAEFTLVPEGDATLVTWAMFGPLTLMARVMSVFCSMDRLMGKEFETGLENLGAAASRTAS